VDMGKRGCAIPLFFYAYLLPNMKYKTVYADPPWTYNKSTKKADVSLVYDTMSLKDILDMKDWINEITEQDCVLFLWTTSPKLPEGLETLKAWGFQYKTSIIWNKIKPYLGYYVNPIHEICLIGGKGKSTPEISMKERNQIPSIITERKTSHSKKPDKMYEIIETLYPTYPRVELFARNTRPGWDSWNPTEGLYLKEDTNV